MSRWKRFRYRLEWLGVKLLAILIPLLPRGGAHWLAQQLGSLAYHLDKRGRTTAIENLRVVYEDRLASGVRKVIARQAFQNFARTVIDQFWSPRLNKDTYQKYCKLEFDDPEAIEAARETGAIWVTPHYSNFEWIALMMGFRGYKFTIIAQDFKNPHLTAIFNHNREVSGHEVIPQQRALFRLLKNLKSGGHAAFLTDLNIKPSKAATVIECMGFKTCVTALHADLMRRAKVPVIPGITIPNPDGTYTMRGFKPLQIEKGMTDQQIAQLCWDAFEPFILENPAPWLWMYKHWRYRPEEEGAHYPEYARVSKAFIKLEKQLAEKAAAATQPESEAK